MATQLEFLLLFQWIDIYFIDKREKEEKDGLLLLVLSLCRLNFSAQFRYPCGIL